MTVGKFITVEGIDGAGKTTQIDFICDYLAQKHIEVVVTREPGGTELGEAIRNLVLYSKDCAIHPNTETLLMFAARVQHIEEKIKPALNAGQWVVCDRFTDSTFAYQGEARGGSWQFLRHLEEWVLDDFQPDLTLLLDLSVDEALTRRHTRAGRQDRFEKESIAFQRKIRQGFLRRAEQMPERIKVVDAHDSIVMIQRRLSQHLEVLGGF